jgi:hypothetical protein
MGKVFRPSLAVLFTWAVILGLPWVITAQTAKKEKPPAAASSAPANPLVNLEQPRTSIPPEMLSAPPSGVRVILSQFALALDTLPPTEQLPMFLAAPSPLRYWTFSLLDPNVRRRLLELMEAEAIRRWPAQEKVIRSFLTKTQAAYDRQRMPEGTPEQFKLKNEVGLRYLAELSPEERAIGRQMHTYFFGPSILLRYQGRVWIRPEAVPQIEAFLKRVPALREYKTDELFVVFSGKTSSPVFFQDYETDGLFVGVRGPTCNCALDVDCVPGTFCQTTKPPYPTDFGTTCHMFGVRLPCSGFCTPGKPRR